ncbi:MAG: rubrerythrin-like domain-containing protein [Haloarcula sp.]
MPTWSDPAPCDDDEQLFECPDCSKRLCSDRSTVTCGRCDTPMKNLSVPRPE